jgi:hypothetical protein
VKRIGMIYCNNIEVLMLIVNDMKERMDLLNASILLTAFGRMKLFNEEVF